jgi:glycosyltransferase involved in cell wall biosynthesis
MGQSQVSLQKLEAKKLGRLRSYYITKKSIGMLLKTTEFSEKLDATDLPPVTIIISTRNRGAKVVLTIKSILEIDYPEFSLVVLDQSDNDLTQQAVLPFQQDDRFHYFSSSTKGLGVGHNTAISLCQTEFVAITDDDCEVKPEWLREIIEAFRLDPHIGLVSGNVIACAYDATQGYIPVFERSEPILLTGIKDNLYQGLGIGACFAIRRSAWEAVNGFDEMLGPGSPLGSLEDRDMAIRLLLAGYYVYHTPRVKVLHYGFRLIKEMRALAFDSWLGFGTSYAKYLKCGHWGITGYMVKQMWVGQALSNSWSHLVNTVRFGRVTPIFVFWVGFIFGLVWPVDYKTKHFKPDNGYKLKALKLIGTLFKTKK